MSDERAGHGPAVASAVDYVQEVRLAVVMYGGVSLAIYINGIAQELLRLVRATAPEPGEANRTHLADGELQSTEPIYRLLGRLVPDADRRRDPLYLKDILERPGVHAIRTRFVVDVLSGTSAGGLNAVYLAKALANDQTLDELKKLWISHGDIRTLLNDRASLEGFSQLVEQDPPRSLLNSERMYLLLLSALEQMSPGDRIQPAISPYVEELDLYVTTTDIRGYPVKLDLADHTVEERRHRHVFHLRYAEPERSGSSRDDFRNDFEDGQNRFLAFVARCTSSFPFAFEPASLEDLDPLLYRSRRTFEKDVANWEHFFRGHLRGGGEAPGGPPDPALVIERAFSDGGILDNRPFSYATDALLRRTSAVPVDRKLLYLEPVPRHSRPDPRRKPDAFETSFAALATVPSYESIRSDLERVIDRNHGILRLRMLHESLDRDMRNATPEERELFSKEKFLELSVSDLVHRLGPSYGPYHRLKISTLADELATLIAHLAGLPERSAEREALGYLARAWVRLSYPEDAQPPQDTQPLLLKRFDISYRLRRLRFLRLKLRELNPLDDEALARLNRSDPEHRFKGEDEDPRLAREVRSTLRDVAAALNAVHVRLRAIGRALRTPLDSMHETRPAEPGVPPAPGDLSNWRRMVDVARWKIADVLRSRVVDEKELANLMRAADGGRDDIAEAIIRRAAVTRGLLDVEQALESVLRPSFAWASATCRAALDPATAPTPVTAEIRRLLLEYYENYQRFDFATLPFTFGTEIGESDFVDIVRISPEDATSLIDESPPPGWEGGERIGAGGSGRRKLAGNQLGNFSAFLRELWRRNDMMWGRLDAAERIVDMMLPGHPDGIELKRRAFRTILAEDFTPADREHLFGLLARAHKGNEKAAIHAEDIPGMLDRLTGPPPNEKLRAVLQALVGADFLVDHVRRDYEVDRAFEPRPSLRALARSLRIIGGLLGGLATRLNTSQKPGAWLAGFGTALWGLVEITVPHSFAAILIRYWSGLLVFAALIVYVAGAATHQETLQKIGIVTIASLAALGIVAAMVQSMLERRRAWPAWLFYVAVVLGGLWLMLARLGNDSISLPVPGGAPLLLTGRHLALGGFLTLVFAFLRQPSEGSRPRLTREGLRWALYTVALGIAVYAWVRWVASDRAAIAAGVVRPLDTGTAMLVYVVLLAMAWQLVLPLRRLLDSLRRGLARSRTPGQT